MCKLASAVTVFVVASAVNKGIADSDVHIPRGYIFENATEVQIQIARGRQFEKEFYEGNYKSDLNVTRGMANCNQKCSNWCWCTSATMAASAFGGGSNCVADEAKVAGHEFRTTCTGSCSGSCNRAGSGSQIADGIRFLCSHSYSTGGVLSQSSLDSALRRGPVVLGVYWTGGGGHAITIGGGSGGRYNGHDPEGYAINTNYAGLTTYRPPYGGVGRWSESVYTNSGASVVV